MDKSRPYIAMCAKAREIQSRWAQQYGDFFVDHKFKVSCWLSRNEADGKMKCGFWVSPKGKVIHICRYTWLPRLDQLIEMAQIRDKRYEAVTQDFFDWAKRPYAPGPNRPGKHLKSLEQLWLAFLMREKFRKHWDGAEWIKPGNTTPTHQGNHENGE
jgi:hypothetical protein